MSAALVATQSHLPGLPASAPVVLICLLPGHARSAPSSSVVEVAQRLPLAERQEALVLAGRGNGLAWRTAYLAAIATVDAEQATSTGGPVIVSLAAGQRQPPPVGTQEVPPDLLEAAEWFLETVQLPKQHDIGRVKERQGYCCQDPECRPAVAQGGSAPPGVQVTWWGR
jgi:hypothetical protein